MADFKAAKVVAALPATLEADTIYLVRRGEGFDLWATNGIGTIVAYPLNQYTITAEQVKQMYESNPDTNAFTNAEKAKLASVEDNATANRPDSENADKEHTHTMVDVTGLDAALADKASTTDPRLSDAREWSEDTVSQEEAEAGIASIRRAWTAERVRQAISALGLKIGITATTAKAGNWMPTWAEVTDKPANYPTDWDTVSDKPAQATRWPTFAEVTDKPVVQTTGNSTTDLMSQKAVTDALATKAALNSTATQQGGLKARLDGTTLYLTNDGTNP